MIDAAICDGDYVVIRAGQSAENGSIVAALLEDEATVKTLRRRDGHTWLMPHNPAFDPIDGDHAVIMGTVVAVLTEGLTRSSPAAESARRPGLVSGTCA